MTRLLICLHRDEAGFIVSSELILVATLVVLGLMVGLTELSFNVNEELEDVGTAVGRVNQSFHISSVKGTKAFKAGSRFRDNFDDGDGEFDISCDSPIRGERPKHYYYN